MINILQLIDDEPVIGGNRYGILENPENPTIGDIQIMENYLRNDTHTKTLFICKNGELAKGKWQYTGGFPEFKEYEGKYFSKMNLKSKKIFDPNIPGETPYKNTNIHIPIPNYEIVGEYHNKKYVKRIVQSVDEYTTIMNELVTSFAFNKK